MKALIRDRYGPPDVLDIRTIDRPVPKDGQVLVRVRAVSVNDWDWGLLFGPTFPFIGRNTPNVRILGSDVAGEVVELGNGAQRFTRGDLVYGDLSASGGWGGFAEYVCASEKKLALKPAAMTFEQAAALPQAGQLAFQALFSAGPLRAGQQILFNGGGGGVGTIGVQLAKAAADVEVTGVDTALKFDMMRRVGFDHVIDYTVEDFTATGRRYDLIIDAKTTRQRSDYVRALKPGGTYATVGGPSMSLLFKLLFVGLGMRLASNKTIRLIGLRPNRNLTDLNERFNAGQLVPVIDGPYTLEDAREALRHFGAGKQQGKVIITVG